MKEVELALEPTNGYINSFTRNTVEGWWELEAGLPANWVYDENSKIGCKIIFENEVGKLVKIFPKKQNVVIDDLINYVEIIIETNKKISEKEKEFTDKMQGMKNLLEEEAKKFYQELEELKEHSFKKKNDDFDKSLEKAETKKPQITRKPRTSKKSTDSVEKEETTK